MPRITARDFRGLDQLTAAWAGILLLAGQNGAGKTSVCTAVAACASGQLLPFEGLTKKQASLLVREGQEDAVIEIEQDDGARAAVRWPSVERRTEGRFLDSSAVAVGLVEPAELTTRARADWLIDLLGALPTKDDLASFLESKSSPDVVDAVWNDVVKLGWDGAWKSAQEEGAKLKGKWEAVAKTKFGVNKALSWRPEGWQTRLETAEEISLVQAVSAARAALDKLKQTQVIQAAEYERLSDLAQHEAAREADVTEAEEHVRVATEKKEVAKRAREQLGHPVSAEDTTPCPHCGVQVVIVGKVLRKPDLSVTREALKQQRLAVAQADGTLQHAEAALREAEMGFLRAKNALEEARRAAAKVNAAEKPNGETAAKQREAERALADAEAGHRMWSAWREAARIRGEIEQQIAVVRALAEDGLRQVIVSQRLTDFNGQSLHPLSHDADWLHVEIQPDLAVTYGGRPYSLLSKGEQYRVRATIQIATAMWRKECLLILDGADILDRNGRNGLIGMVTDSNIPAILGMTLLRREDMPDLGAAGLGTSIWLEDGTVVASTQEAAVA